MNARALSALLSAVLFPAVLCAQYNDCPHEMARDVGSKIEYGPSTSCTGIDYKLGQVVITTTQSACPTFVVYTPKHQMAVASTHETEVDPVGTAPITLIGFRCVTTYLIFIPLSSYCEVGDRDNIGSVLQLVTKSC